MAERQHHRNELAKLITNRLMRYAASGEALPDANTVFGPHDTEDQNPVIETAPCNR